MLTLIVSVLLGCYVVLVFLANFNDGQCDFECDLEYSSIPVYPGKSQNRWHSSEESVPLSSSLAIECSQRTPSKTTA